MTVLKNLGIIFSQALSCCIKLSDGFGQPDEMLSARAWRLREQNPKFCLWIDRLFFWDKDHCEECYAIEKQRKQSPSEYRC